MGAHRNTVSAIPLICLPFEFFEHPFGEVGKYPIHTEMMHADDIFGLIHGIDIDFQVICVRALDEFWLDGRQRWMDRESMQVQGELYVVQRRPIDQDPQAEMLVEPSDFG